MKVRLGSMRTGAAGRVQEVICDLEKDDPKDWYAGIGNWFIDAPGQSAAWRHYVLSAIHLRAIDGVKPAHIREPHATHEFMMMALDPKCKPDPLHPDTWSFLRPHNLAEQVKLRDDSAAIMLLDQCATNIAEGRLWAEPPLSGQVEPWRSFLRQWASESPSSN